MFQLGFPIELYEDVSKVVEIIPTETYNNVFIGVSKDKIEYLLNGATVEFPYRIYFLDVADETLNKLTFHQQMVLHCIYSRSCDGFVRQRHLRALLLMEYEDWAIPYIVKVCDEYVVEILEMTYTILKEQNTECFKKFCRENNKLFCKSYARMISYWNEFYRDKYSQFYKYIGRKLFKECFGYSRAFERGNPASFI
ncbi:hypothetical protein SRRS_05190 [Sporomusa rhizae]|uniref:hypothetical protein n=1 Tax=Sporomusa rhizae TaxID=357999 RepID=UPI00352A4A59